MITIAAIFFQTSGFAKQMVQKYTGAIESEIFHLWENELTNLEQTAILLAGLEDIQHNVLLFYKGEQAVDQTIFTKIMDRVIQTLSVDSLTIYTQKSEAYIPLVTKWKGAIKPPSDDASLKRAFTDIDLFSFSRDEDGLNLFLTFYTPIKATLQDEEYVIGVLAAARNIDESFIAKIKDQSGDETIDLSLILGNRIAISTKPELSGQWVTYQDNDIEVIGGHELLQHPELQEEAVDYGEDGRPLVQFLTTLPVRKLNRNLGNLEIALIASFIFFLVLGLALTYILGELITKPLQRTIHLLDSLSRESQPKPVFDDNSKIYGKLEEHILHTFERLKDST